MSKEERTVLVMNVPQDLADEVLMYLANPKLSGGAIESSHLNADAALVVCFKRKEVADCMLKKGSLKVQGVQFVITGITPPKSKPVVIAHTTKQANVSSRRRAVPLLPHKAVNILLLGETGVGKSTWINGFINYLIYPTLEEATETGIKSLIPMSFTMTDSNYKEIVVATDNSVDYKNTGQSCTQYPKTYSFFKDDIIVRLIDTPGIGDTRGIEKDKENFNNILKHIATFDELHGIVILLKPNQARITVSFEYCIKELLSNLHKDACRNIVVCFTNARGTFYQPGDTLPIVRRLFYENNIAIDLNRSTISCIDSEAVRYLAAVKYLIGTTFTASQIKDFTESWNTSVQEIERLLKYVASLKPHPVKNTLTIIAARHMILGLSMPLAEITSNIQTNLAVIKAKKEELSASTANKEELAKKLFIPLVDPERVQLTPSRKVCTALKCIKEVIEGNRTRTVHYCSEDFVNKYRFKDNFKLNTKKKICKKCNCDTGLHTIITYETIYVQKEVIDKQVNEQVQGLAAAIQKIEYTLTTMKQRIAELEAEQEQIINAGVKFACFLKVNAITPFNDVMHDYMEILIKRENEKSTNKMVLKGLIEQRERYLKNVNDLEEAMNKPNRTVNPPTPEEIKNLTTNLYSMKHFGSKIEEIARVVEAAEMEIVKEDEVKVPVERSQSSNLPNILQKLAL